MARFAVALLASLRVADAQDLFIPARQLRGSNVTAETVEPSAELAETSPDETTGFDSLGPFLEEPSPEQDANPALAKQGWDNATGLQVAPSDAGEHPMVEEKDASPPDVGEGVLVSMGVVEAQAAIIEYAKLAFDVVKFTADLVKDNQPVLNFQGDEGSVKPKNQGWKHSTGWQRRSTWLLRRMRSSVDWMTKETDYDVVLKIAVHFQCRGRFDGIAGFYLENINAVAAKVKVDWGTWAKVSIRTGNPTNMGTSTNPIPRLPLYITSAYGNHFSKYHHTDTVWIDGNCGHQVVLGE